MLVVAIIICELMLGAFFSSVNAMNIAVSMTPPSGVFGLIFLAWYEREAIGLIAAVFFGLLADANAGTPLGVYLIPYLFTFMLMYFGKPLLPSLNVFYFALSSAASAAFIHLLASFVYLAAIPGLSYRGFSFSAHTFIASAFFGILLFPFYAKIRKSRKTEE